MNTCLRAGRHGSYRLARCLGVVTISPEQNRPARCFDVVTISPEQTHLRPSADPLAEQGADDWVVKPVVAVDKLLLRGDVPAIHKS